MEKHPYQEQASQESNGKEKDPCVICGEETEYSVDTRVEDRRDYTEGAGQLCPKCFGDLFLSQKCFF